MATLKRPPVFRKDGTIEIHLTQGYIALIDAQDAHLAAFNWCAAVNRVTGKVYAARNVPSVNGKGKSTLLLLHKAVMEVEISSDIKLSHTVEIDHENGDTLDCRRGNLRETTPTGNRRNRGAQRNSRSGHMGVYEDRRYGTWRASIDGEHLGSFHWIEDAIAARLAAEKERWGIEPRRAAAHGLPTPEAFDFSRGRRVNKKAPQVRVKFSAREQRISRRRRRGQKK